MKIKALVVDRRTMVRNALTQPLKNIGVRDVVEMNADEIVTEPIGAGEFDIVFIEFNTLIEAGETLVKSIRKQDPQVPIIVTYPETTNFADLKKYCPAATAYLKSPFTSEQLGEIVKQQLQMLTA
jgi:DNA-binding NtrC family response regulator